MPADVIPISAGKLRRSYTAALAEIGFAADATLEDVKVLLGRIESSGADGTRVRAIIVAMQLDALMRGHDAG